MLNIDCMEYMKTCEDKKFDLAIVDPPYGIHKKITNNGSKTKNKGNKFALLYDEKSWDKNRPDKEYFEELIRVSKNQIIYGGNYFADLLPASSGWILWDKMGEGLSVVNDELIYTSFYVSIKKFKRCHGRDKGFMNPEGANIHPTQKPVALYRWLLDNYAKPGQLILDTHAGSFSSAVACKEKGFSGVFVELDKDYFEAGKKRVDKTQRQYEIGGQVEKMKDTTRKLFIDVQK